jgi:hypothetical protein
MDSHHGGPLQHAGHAEDDELAGCSAKSASDSTCDSANSCANTAIRQARGGRDYLLVIRADKNSSLKVRKR